MEIMTKKNRKAQLDAEIEAFRQAAVKRDATAFESLCQKMSQHARGRIHGRLLIGVQDDALDSASQTWFRNQAAWNSRVRVQDWDSATSQSGGPTPEQRKQVRLQLARGEWAPWQAFKGLKSVVGRDRMDLVDDFLPHVSKVDYSTLINDTATNLSTPGMKDFLNRMVSACPSEDHTNAVVSLIRTGAEQDDLSFAKQSFARLSQPEQTQAIRWVNVFNGALGAASRREEDGFVRWLIEDLGVSPESEIMKALRNDEFSRADLMACHTSGKFLESCWSQARILCGDDVHMPLTRIRVQAQKRANKVAPLDPSMTVARGRRRP